MIEFYRKEDSLVLKCTDERLEQPLLLEAKFNKESQEHSHFIATKNLGEINIGLALNMALQATVDNVLLEELGEDLGIDLLLYKEIKMKEAHSMIAECFCSFNATVFMEICIIFCTFEQLQTARLEHQAETNLN